MLISTTPQQRAGFTNRARNAFRQTYGIRSYEVVSRLASGWNAEEINDLLGESVTSIAAYQANLTRGTYQYVYHSTNDEWFNISACNW